MKLFRSEPFRREAAERLTEPTESVLDRQDYNRSATGLSLEEPRTGMNLNGMSMNHRMMTMNSNDEFELTRLEIACLKLAANGLKPVEIGNELEIAERDIDTLLSSAEHKLGARNRLHAIGIAVSQGLIGIDGK